VCAFECEQAKESEKGASALMVMRYSCIHAREKDASDCSYFMFIVVIMNIRTPRAKRGRFVASCNLFHVRQHVLSIYTPAKTLTTFPLDWLKAKKLFSMGWIAFFGARGSASHFSFLCAALQREKISGSKPKAHVQVLPIISHVHSTL
jgi:hypothetical protein